MSHTYLLNGTTTPAISAGQVTAVTVSQDAVWVVFHNVSVNQDILLSLGVTNPGPTTTPGGEWPYVCPAGHSIKVPVPGTSTTQTAVAPYWQGKLWVLPINIAGQQAPTGQQPPLGNLWIMTFGAGETPAEVAPNSTGVSQIGQQRVIALPPTPFARPATITTPTASSDYPLDSTNLTAAQIAAQEAFGYVFNVDVRLPIPAAGTATGMAFEIKAEIVDASFTVLLAQVVYQGVVATGLGAAATGQVFINPFVRANPAPDCIFMSAFGATAVQWRWTLFVLGILNAPASALVNFSGGVDIANPTTRPGTYGNTVSSGATGLF